MMDMKMTPQQAPSASDLLGGEPNEGPAYDEGLELCLTGETLKRLAIGEGNLPPVGTKYKVIAIGEVTEVSKEGQQIETQYEVCLQLTALELKDPNEPNEQQQAAKQVAAMYNTTAG